MELNIKLEVYPRVDYKYDSGIGMYVAHVPLFDIYTQEYELSTLEKAVRDAINLYVEMKEKYNTKFRDDEY